MTKQTNSKKTAKVNNLQKLLHQHKQTFQTLENGKIKCKLTGHQFMPSQENFLAHLNSKSYKKASETQYDISKYEKILSTHKDGEHFLFCRLTGAKVPKKKTAIQKHVNGKRFKKRFQEYLENLEQQQEDQLVEDEEDLEDIEQQEEDNDNEEEDDQQEQQEQQQKPIHHKKSQDKKSQHKNHQQKSKAIHKNGHHNNKGSKNHQKQARNGKHTQGKSKPKHHKKH